MQAAEEMPLEVLIDAWYLTYENKEVRFPLIRGADSTRVFLSTPLLTAMWKNRHAAMGFVGSPTDTTRHHFVEYHGKNREWALHTHMIGIAIASVEVNYKGN